MSSVQVEQNHGGVEEFHTQALVQNAIFQEIHQKHFSFFLNEEVPICQGYLRESLGYLSHSPTAEAILKGSCVFPLDFDEATRELCLECARIRSSIPKDFVNSTISPSLWKHGWGK